MSLDPTERCNVHQEIGKRVKSVDVKKSQLDIGSLDRQRGSLISIANKFKS